jgi:hypothetical protein
MKAFGYKRGDEESETPMELREATILFESLEDLRRLQAFIEQAIAARTAHGSLGKGPWYEQLRDRDKAWTKDEADVILAMSSTVNTPTP